MSRNEDVAEVLTGFIVSELAARSPGEPVTPEFPIIEGGLVDSLGLFRLIAFIEERFAVNIAPEEVLFENFSSVGVIQRLIESKRERHVA